MSEKFIHDTESLRKEKDSYLKRDLESPIPPEDRPGFKGLKYFPPSRDYRVKAHLTKFPNPEAITMVTSKGTIKPYVKYGVFSFDLHGKKLQLHGFKPANDPHEHSLFVPFTDETSGRETYGAGRYLDIEEVRDSDYVIDFNLAYNPYCAYSENYVCPFPGGENKLPISVEAGEKNYK